MAQKICDLFLISCFSVETRVVFYLFKELFCAISAWFRVGFMLVDVDLSSCFAVCSVAGVCFAGSVDMFIFCFRFALLMWIISLSSHQ